MAYMRLLSAGEDAKQVDESGGGGGGGGGGGSTAGSTADIAGLQKLLHLVAGG
jgi:hypothetical protein